MILTYEKIRELKQLEKDGKLQVLPENFLKYIAEYITLKKGSEEENSAKNLIMDLYESRRKKIMNLAFSLYKMDNIPKNMDGLELEFYNDLVEVMKKHNKDFEELFKKPSEIGGEAPKDEIVNLGETETPLKDKESEPTTNEQKSQNAVQEDQNKNSHIKEETGEKFSENNSQKDKLKVVFLLDIPEIVTPTGEVCSFKEEEEKELDSEFAVQLKEQGFCRFK